MKGIKRYKFPVAKQLRKNVQHGESMKVLLSHVQLFVTLWTVALQTSLSMGLSRQEYWSGLPCPSSGDLRDSGIKPGSPALQVESLPSEPLGKPNIIWQLKLNFFKKGKTNPCPGGRQLV